MQFACDVLSTQLYKLVRAEAMVGLFCISSVISIVRGVATEVFVSGSDMSILDGQRATSMLSVTLTTPFHTEASFILRSVQVSKSHPLALYWDTQLVC